MLKRTGVAFLVVEIMFTAVFGPLSLFVVGVALAGGAVGYYYRGLRARTGEIEPGVFLWEK